VKKGFKQLIAEANGQVDTWSVADARTAFDRGDVVFVDIREPDELVREGMVPGAESSPRGMLEFHADPESQAHKPVFSSDRTIVLYCASGGRSALAAKTLQDMGFENVVHLGGGFKAWVAGGGPVQKTA
jgi:rhodanese-related sulfurtransferase